MHEVLDVKEGSPAHRRGVRPGDFVESINGEPLIDGIDYQALTASRRVRLALRDFAGRVRAVDLVKRTGQPLGIRFRDTLSCRPRTCSNRCVFCFVDQMPQGMRQSLYLKDDDWRLSLMMGNFITLTNVGDAEMDRIIRRKASPLYISVHATDSAVRTAMLRNPNAGSLLTRLERLKAGGIAFHTQVVLCPGINDRLVLQNTLEDLLKLRPAALSVALVPVGLTKHREGLSPILPFSRDDALAALRICREFQQKALEGCGTRFVFPADELLCLAGEAIPAQEGYEGYPQLENGVGMMRKFEEELREASQADRIPEGGAPRRPLEVCVPCGTSIAPHMRGWSENFSPPGVHVQVVPVVNRYFGETVTVSGLIVGRDLERQLAGVGADLILIPDVMLNHEKSLFLDGGTPKELQERLGVRLEVADSSGTGFYGAMAKAAGSRPLWQEGTDA